MKAGLAQDQPLNLRILQLGAGIIILEVHTAMSPVISPPPHPCCHAVQR
jgi:hypothetical protein